MTLKNVTLYFDTQSALGNQPGDSEDGILPSGEFQPIMRAWNDTIRAIRDDY